MGAPTGWVRLSCPPGAYGNPETDLLKAQEKNQANGMRLTIFQNASLYFTTVYLRWKVSQIISGETFD